MAVVYACERFNQFVYGKHILIESDHKPLETIIKKPLCQAPARVQRLMLRLQKYQVEIVHKSGKEMNIADALSRAYLPCSDQDTLGEQIDLHVHLLLKSLPISDAKLEEFKVKHWKRSCVTRSNKTCSRWMAK